MNIDFSQFHPLDHSVLRCSGYPGGRRRHVDLWWTFMGHERVTVAWKHATLRHEWRAWASRDRVTDKWRYFVGCAGCDAVPDAATAARLIDAMKGKQWPGKGEA